MSDLAKRFPPRRDPPGPLRLPSVERKKPKGLKKVCKERKKARMERDFGPQAKACRRMPCCVCGRRPADPHHWPSRGAGGRDEDALPFCRRCHDAFHREGADTFQERRQIILAVVKAEIQDAMKKHDCAAWGRLEEGGLRVVCSICERECEEPLP